jgi:hypothetical protein
MQPVLAIVLSRLTTFAGVNANCGLSTGAQDCDTGLPNVTASTNQVQEILAVVFGISAALSVLMIVIAGLRFITAQSNAQEIAKARNTIIYALVGLFVSLLAEAIVSFVLGKL